MMSLVLLTACWLHCLPVQADSLVARSIAQAPVLDGRVGDREYGTPTVRFATAAGEVRVWLVRHGGFLHVAATLPDSTFYWGDDFVISLSPNGRAEPTLDVGDRQWYLRRMLDSSVVSTVTSASGGRWLIPGQPQPMLGATRHHADWDVASTSSATGWSIELRIRESVVHPGTAAPRVAFRTYDDRPQGWWSWPSAPAGMPSQRVERTPSLWIPIVLR